MKEYFDIVDRNDKVIGRALRSECHANPKLIHRGVFVVIVNEKSEILLQKRSMRKDLYKGTWGISVGGHNRAGESYEHAAKREMKEELGLKLPLKKLGKILIRQETETEFDMCFAASIVDEKIKPSKSEIDEIKFFSIKEIRALKPEEIVPDVLQVLNFYLKHRI